MKYEIDLRQSYGVSAISRRLRVSQAGLGAAISGSLAEVYRYLGETGGAPSDAPFVIHHERLKGGDRWDVEICAPVEHAIEPPRGFRFRLLPEQTMATTVHHGSHHELGAAYDALRSWIEARDLAVAGPPRETYLTEPGPPAMQTTTLIEWPVEPILASVGRAPDLS